MFTALWLIAASISVSGPTVFGILPSNWDPWFRNLINVYHLNIAGPTALLGSGIITFLTRFEKQVSDIVGFWDKAQNWLRKVLFSISVTIFAFLLLVGLEIAVFLVAKKLEHLLTHNHPTQAMETFALLSTVVFLILFSIAMSLPVNINRFSAHTAYRNRLVRTFLGASNLKRKYNPFTGFSHRDNIFLHDMMEHWQPRKRGEPNEPPNKPTGDPLYQRPLHIVCAAVNLATGERLAWQERKAVSFTFSGCHSGSNELGYRPSGAFGGKQGVSLGTAMAVSGAAANSGMGFYSSPLKSFFLTLLNARLGWWLGNPQHADNWKRNSPLFAIFPLLQELLSQTNRKANWINVSDGGHFDNTGVYEMLRRRCTRILLFDAETTRKGITNVAQRARIDMGVQIRLVDAASEGFPCEHYQIDYLADETGPACTGTLIRIYPAIGCTSRWSSFESCEHKRTNPAFPDDSLEDQFFTESIFESYRKLGFDIVRSLLSSESSSPIGIVDLRNFFESCASSTKKTASEHDNGRDGTRGRRSTAASRHRNRFQSLRGSMDEPVRK